MSKVKLIDVKNKVEEDVEFGTCELCFGIADHHYTVMEFEVDGKLQEVELGMWSWGDYIDCSYEIKDVNILQFAEWLNKQDVKLENGIVDCNDVSCWLHDFISEHECTREDF